MDLRGEEAHAGFELHGRVVELVAGGAVVRCFISDERAVVGAQMCDVVVLPTAEVWAVVACLCCCLCHCCSKRDGQQQ